MAEVKIPLATVQKHIQAVSEAVWADEKAGDKMFATHPALSAALAELIAVSGGGARPAEGGQPKQGGGNG